MDSYPRPQNLTYADRVLSNEGPPSRGDPFKRTERKLAGPGRPGTVDGLVAGGALGGAAPCLGRARSPCRARGAHHLPPRVPIGALAPPTAPSPRAVREGLANLGRIAPREREAVVESCDEVL